MKYANLFKKERLTRTLSQATGCRYRVTLLGTGETVLAQTAEKAERMLLDKMCSLFQGEYTPFLIQFRASTVIIWRDKNEWLYGFLHNKTTPSGLTTSGEFLTREIVEQAVRRHLSRGEWDGQEEISPILLDADDQKNFGEWAREEKRCQHLCTLGWSFEEARTTLAHMSGNT